MGTILVEDMISNSGLDISTEDIEMINAFITGEAKSKFKDFQWVFDIVNNKRNGIDVDKLDYLCRDVKQCTDCSTSFERDILLDSARVCSD